MSYLWCPFLPLYTVGSSFYSKFSLQFMVKKTTNPLLGNIYSDKFLYYSIKTNTKEKWILEISLFKRIYQCLLIKRISWNRRRNIWCPILAFIFLIVSTLTLYSGIAVVHSLPFIQQSDNIILSLFSPFQCLGNYPCDLEFCKALNVLCPITTILNLIKVFVTFKKIKKWYIGFVNK